MAVRPLLGTEDANSPGDSDDDPGMEEIMEEFNKDNRIMRQSSIMRIFRSWVVRRRNRASTHAGSTPRPPWEV